MFKAFKNRIYNYRANFNQTPLGEGNLSSLYEVYRPFQLVDNHFIYCTKHPFVKEILSLFKDYFFFQMGYRDYSLYCERSNNNGPLVRYWYRFLSFVCKYFIVSLYFIGSIFIYSSKNLPPRSTTIYFVLGLKMSNVPTSSWTPVWNVGMYRQYSEAASGSKAKVKFLPSISAWNPKNRLAFNFTLSCRWLNFKSHLINMHLVSVYGYYTRGMTL